MKLDGELWIVLEIILGKILSKNLIITVKVFCIIYYFCGGFFRVPALSLDCSKRA